MEVLCSMFVGRRITAERYAARLASAKMDPPAISLDALFTLTYLGRQHFLERSNVLASIYLWFLHQCYYFT